MARMHPRIQLIKISKLPFKICACQRQDLSDFGTPIAESSYEFDIAVFLHPVREGQRR